MLASPDGRIQLAAAPVRVVSPPVLEAVFVGLAAVVSVPAGAADAVAAAAQLGFTADRNLCGAPLAFTDAASFDAAFPQDASWLARAVHDYFAGGGRRAWVVRIDPGAEAPLEALVGVGTGGLAVADTGLDIAMQVPTAGLLLLPDIEQACLAQAVPPPGVPVPPPAVPQFQPLAFRIATPAVVVSALAVPLPVAPAFVLGRVSAALAKQRPDMLCLFALPVGADAERSLPALIARARAYVFGDDDSLPDLPRLQALAPLLRDPSGATVSPSGVFAGALAAAAETDGVWRSLGGRVLASAATPLRRIEANALQALRDAGIVALRAVPGGIAPDSDILACRNLPGSARLRAAPTRRLTGLLLRRLAALGEQLVFENILGDGRVELVLNDAFAALLAQGALNGRSLDEAVSIVRGVDGPGAVSFDIGFNAALPVETMRLRFVDGTVSTTLGRAA